jgi:hypothetical protein
VQPLALERGAATTEREESPLLRGIRYELKNVTDAASQTFAKPLQCLELDPLSRLLKE